MVMCLRPVSPTRFSVPGPAPPLSLFSALRTLPGVQELSQVGYMSYTCSIVGLRACQVCLPQLHLSTRQHVLGAAWARARHLRRPRGCAWTLPAFRWVKPSSERGKGVANYISLFEVAAMGRLRAPMEEEDPTEGGSLKEDHL